MKKIGFIGECMIELNGQAFGDIKQKFGGDTFNTALYLHRLDNNIYPHYISALGHDALSAQLITLWQQEGIDTSLTLLDEQHTTGLYQISLDAVGERSFSYWRKNSAAAMMLQHPDFPTIKAQLVGFDYLYLSGISIAILPDEDKSKLIALLTELHASGVKIIFDSNYRAKLWNNPSQAQDLYRQIIPLCEYALITFDDEKELWADTDPQDVTDRLQRLGLNKFVLKLGEQGCCYYHRLENETQVIHYPTNKINNVVDTTSAGDAFNAGFICALLHGQSIEKGCHLGNQLAGIVIQHPGAIIAKEATDSIALFNIKKGM